MTTTRYITESHTYTELTSCDDPRSCTRKSHWQANDFEFKTVKAARESSDDAPAVRIIKVIKTVEVIEVFEPVFEE